MLSPEQIEEVKTQLREQIGHLPEEKRNQALEQIETMSPQAIESLVQQQKSEKTIFRNIIDQEIESVQIGENPQAVAVLDIYPISKGHTLIIPKEPASTIQDLPSEAFTLAKDLAKKIEKNLKASSSEMQTEKKFGEAIINLIPIYDKPLTLQSPRNKETLENLRSIAEKINPLEKPSIIQIKKTTEKLPVEKRKRRVP